MEERRGFEPLKAFTLTVFKTVAIDHSAISPVFAVRILPLEFGVGMGGHFGLNCWGVEFSAGGSDDG